MRTQLFAVILSCLCLNSYVFAADSLCKHEFEYDGKQYKMDVSSLIGKGSEDHGYWKAEYNGVQDGKEFIFDFFFNLCEGVEMVSTGGHTGECFDTTGVCQDELLHAAGSTRDSIDVISAGELNTMTWGQNIVGGDSNGNPVIFWTQSMTGGGHLEDESDRKKNSVITYKCPAPENKGKSVFSMDYPAFEEHTNSSGVVTSETWYFVFETPLACADGGAANVSCHKGGAVLGGLFGGALIGAGAALALVFLWDKKRGYKATHMRLSAEDDGLIDTQQGGSVL